MRKCGSCGREFEAKTTRRKFCSDLCRVRASRGVRASNAAREAVAGVTSAVEAELRRVDRLSSPLGQAALAVARRIDSGQESGTALASLVKQLDATMRSAREGVAVAESTSERLRQIRLERLGVG